MKYLKFILLSLPISMTISCQNTSSEQDLKPRMVEVKQVEGNYRLVMDGEPFFVEGAGCDDGDIAALASHGANSFRTWMDSPVHIPADEVLRLAKENNLMVMMGLNVARERHGFDYDDEAAVQAQFERIKGK